MPDESQPKSSPSTRAKRKTPKPRVTRVKSLCGLVMPISAIDGCNEQHWSDVRDVLEEAITEASFEPRLVCDADEVGIIQERIIQNVYNDPIVVCDVSGKNPNVMFELGMRLAFDKPTIIVKDDKTQYSFDTAPIEHLEYPRDLRFAKIVDFQTLLAQKIQATYSASKRGKGYTTFLKSFGSFAVAKLDTKKVDRSDLILEELRTVKSLLLRQDMISEPAEERRQLLDTRITRSSDTLLKKLVRDAITEARSLAVPPKNLRHFVTNRVANSRFNHILSKHYTPEEFYNKVRNLVLIS